VVARTNSPRRRMNLRNILIVVCISRIWLIFTYAILDTVDVDPLSFWKENQHRFPALAAMARDTLSVPATGAGVERLFNTARDICHYRRGRLNATTIQELMMFRCSSKFDIEEDEAVYLKEFASENELEARKEARADPDQLVIDQISDTEEQDDQEGGDDDQEEGDNYQMGEIEKGEEVIRSDHEAEAAEPPLPISKDNNTQIRTSVRARKRTRRDDDGFTYY
jgi:hypothetical protein